MKDWLKLFGSLAAILISIAFAVLPTVLICIALLRYLEWI